MAHKIHATGYDIAISGLMHELVLKIDDAERCQEMLSRLACYEPTEMLPADVVDFIGNYAPIEIVDQHGMVLKAIDVVGKALEALMKAINWIIDKLKEIFKFLFDSQYRACKQTLDIQRRILTISANPNAITKFENTNCSIVSKVDVDKINFKTQYLTALIRNCAKMDDQAFIQTLMKTFAADAGVALDQNNLLLDSIPNPSPMRNTTFAAAGWTIDGVNTTITDYLTTIKGIEELKAVQTDIEKQAHDLKKRAEDSALKGGESGAIIALQKEAATKIMMVKTIGYAIAISVRRSNNILAFLLAIYKELNAANSAKASS